MKTTEALYVEKRICRPRLAIAMKRFRWTGEKLSSGRNKCVVVTGSVRVYTNAIFVYNGLTPGNHKP